MEISSMMIATLVVDWIIKTSVHSVHITYIPPPSPVEIDSAPTPMVSPISTPSISPVGTPSMASPWDWPLSTFTGTPRDGKLEESDKEKQEDAHALNQAFHKYGR